MIVACHWNMFSPVGPALQEEGGSRPRSINSYRTKAEHADDPTEVEEENISEVTIQQKYDAAQPIRHIRQI